MNYNNNDLLTKAENIFEEVFFEQTNINSEIRSHVLSCDWHLKSLREILSEFTKNDQWWKDNLGDVSKQATQLFNNWIQENNISTSFDSIDEKGVLHTSFPVEIIRLPGYTHEVKIIHPITQEEIIYNYNMASVTIDEHDLNQATKTPKDIKFYCSEDGIVMGKAFPTTV